MNQTYPTKSNRRVNINLDLSLNGARAIHKLVGAFTANAENGVPEGLDGSGIYKFWLDFGAAITKAEKPRFRASGSCVFDDDSYGDEVARFQSRSNPYVDSYDLARAYAKSLNEKG